MYGTLVEDIQSQCQSSTEGLLLQQEVNMDFPLLVNLIPDSKIQQHLNFGLGLDARFLSKLSDC